MATMVKVLDAPSSLEKFVINFEHDLTWAEVRRKLKTRRKKVDKQPKQ